MKPMRRMMASAGNDPMEIVRLRQEGRLGARGPPVTMADLEEAVAATRPSVSPGDTAKFEAWEKQFGST